MHFRGCQIKIVGRIGRTLILTGMCFGMSCGTPRRPPQPQTTEIHELQEPVLATEDLNDEMSIFHLPSFWHTQNQDTIEFKDLKGNVLVVVMFYTSCKAACPRLVADMQSIEAKVRPSAKKNIKYVLVTIDPEVDTPNKLKKFSKINKMDGDQWLFLHSDEESIRLFANVLSVKYAQISPIDFSHSNIISVFDEHGILQHQQEGLGVDNEETVNKIINLSH